MSCPVSFANSTALLELKIKKEGVGAADWCVRKGKERHHGNVVLLCAPSLSGELQECGKLASLWKAHKYEGNSHDDSSWCRSHAPCPGKKSKHVQKSERDSLIAAIGVLASAALAGAGRVKRCLVHTGALIDIQASLMPIRVCVRQEAPSTLAVIA